MAETMFGIILVVCGFFSTARTESSLYKYVSTQHSWREARQFCKDNYNGSLYNNVSVDTLSSIPFNSNIPDNATFWTGQMSILSAWISYIGCYNNIPHFSTKKEFAENNAGLCQLYCNTSDYFALKGNQCICLTIGISSYGKTSEASCAISCRNPKVFELCGGNKTYSVYHKGNFRDSASGDEHCVAVNCSHTNFYARRCSEKHHIMCNGTMARGQITNGSASFNWTEGVKTCFTYKSILAYDTNHLCQLNKPLSSNDFYWIGVYRESLEINRIGFPIANERKKCLAITKTGVSSREQCNNTLPFVCQYTQTTEMKFSKLTPNLFTQTSNIHHQVRDSTLSSMTIYDSADTSNVLSLSGIEKTNTAPLNYKASLNFNNSKPSYKTAMFHPDMTSTVMINVAQSMIALKPLASHSNLTSDPVNINTSILSLRGVTNITSIDACKTLSEKRKTLRTQLPILISSPVPFTVEETIYRTSHTIMQNNGKRTSVSITASSSPYVLSNLTVKQHSITYDKETLNFEISNPSHKIAKTKSRIYPKISSAVMIKAAQSMITAKPLVSDSNLAIDLVKEYISDLPSRNAKNVTTENRDTAQIHIFPSSPIPITVEDHIYRPSKTEFRMTMQNEGKRFSFSLTPSSQSVLNNLDVQSSYLTVDTEILPVFADQVLVTTPIVNNHNGSTYKESVTKTISATLKIISLLPKSSRFIRGTSASTFYAVTTEAERLKNDDQENRVLIASVTGSCGGLLLVIIALVVFLALKKKRSVVGIHENTSLKNSEGSIKTDHLEEDIVSKQP